MVYTSKYSVEPNTVHKNVKLIKAEIWWGSLSDEEKVKMYELEKEMVKR